MKIAIIANTAWYLHNFRLNLMLHLLAQHHEVISIAPRDIYAGKIEAAGVRFVHWNLSRQGTNPLVELKSLSNLVILLSHEQPDILLTYTPKANLYSGIAAILLGGITLPNISGLGQGFARSKWFATLMRLLYRVALSKASITFFQNDEDRRLFIASGLVTDQSSKRLPGSGVDLKRFQVECRPNTAARFGKVFLFASRLRLEKGLKDFVDAAREVKTTHPLCRFLVLGFIEPQGPGSVTPDEIKAWEREGLIDYLGSTEDIRPHLLNADCVVLPSYYKEGVPRILLEAAASGRCIITSDMPGCKDAVWPGVSGYVCQPRNPSKLATLMRRVADMSADQLDAMGREGRRLMEQQFDERLVIAAYDLAINAIGRHKAV